MKLDYWKWNWWLLWAQSKRMVELFSSSIVEFHFHLKMIANGVTWNLGENYNLHAIISDISPTLNAIRSKIKFLYMVRVEIHGISIFADNFHAATSFTLNYSMNDDHLASDDSWNMFAFMLDISENTITCHPLSDIKFTVVSNWSTWDAPALKNFSFVPCNNFEQFNKLRLNHFAQFSMMCNNKQALNNYR